MGPRTIEEFLGADRLGLVCLNIQRDYTEEATPLFVKDIEPILETIERLTAYARSQRWSIAHVHSRGRAPLFARGWPIPGFEPRTNEPVVFKDRYSAFCSAAFARTLHDLSADAYLVVGFALALDCVATAHAAYEHGVRLIFVEDAIGTPDMSGIPAESITDVVRTVLSPVAEFVRLRPTAIAGRRLLGATPND